VQGQLLVHHCLGGELSAGFSLGGRSHGACLLLLLLPLASVLQLLSLQRRFLFRQEYGLGSGGAATV
jgi:hypothetical protein